MHARWHLYVLQCADPRPLHIVNALWGKNPANSPCLPPPVLYTSIFYKLGSPQAISNLQWSCACAFQCIGSCACLLIKKMDCHSGDPFSARSGCETIIAGRRVGEREYDNLKWQIDFCSAWSSDSHKQREKKWISRIGMEFNVQLHRMASHQALFRENWNVAQIQYFFFLGLSISTSIHSECFVNSITSLANPCLV